MKTSQPGYATGTASPYNWAYDRAAKAAAGMLKGAISMARTEYGAKFTGSDDPDVALLVVEPGKSTLLSEKDPRNIRNGLRGHPGTIRETVTVLEGGPVLYRFLDPAKNEPLRQSTQQYSAGEIFDSVSRQGVPGEQKPGYWHVIGARGIAMLLIGRVPDRAQPAPPRK